MRCKRIVCLLLLLFGIAHGGEESKNLPPNPGFDSPDGRGWNVRGKPITLDPKGAYETPCCRVVMPKDEKYPNFYFVCSEHIPAKPNRTYTFKVLVKTAHTAGAALPSVRLVNAEGKSVGYKRAAELEPGERDWQEYAVTFTTPSTTATMQVYLIHRQLEGPVWYDECRLTERPPRRVPAIGTGRAVTFEGGPGALDMRVEHVQERDGKISVRTTGADYVIDPAAGTIAGSQRIEVQRPMAAIRFPQGLKGLRVLRHDAQVCVLTTGELDIGIQCDSLMVLAAAEKQAVVCTGEVAAKWARYEGGHVLAIDDRGGVGVYHHAIPGSGVEMDAPVAPTDLAKPGWTCTHTIGAGVRLGLSIFPPRPFDWEKSFKWRLCHTGGACPPDPVLEKWSRHVTHMCLHASAMWQGPHAWCGPYKHRDAADFRRCIATCKRLGMTVIPYMSPWYYHIRDAQAFMKQLAEQKAEFGFRGIYYDGLWHDDWLESYRVMRMTRALFPEGCVYLHTTIGPPLWSKTMWCPFLDTYADFVLRGESYSAKGPDDAYIRYVAAGYRLSNALGMMKGNKWEGCDAKQQRQIMLSYNGRSRWGTYPSKSQEGEFVFPGQNGPLKGLFVDWYFPELDRLEKEWRAGRWRP